MDRLWSPWRSKHIERAGQSQHAGAYDDVFVRIASEPERDAENLVVWRGETIFVVMNLYPYNNGHLMVVPFRRVADYEALTADEQVELAQTIERCIRWLRTALDPDGFNVGMNLGRAGGAGIPGHLHLHVVPRWDADTNFMATVADAKVIPEALETTYRKLRHAVETVGTDAKNG